MAPSVSLKAGNPLNALPVPAKQDATARGWYVRYFPLVLGEGGEHRRQVYAVCASLTATASASRVRGYGLSRMTNPSPALASLGHPLPVGEGKKANATSRPLTAEQ